MRVSRIYWRNFMGIDELEIEPGAITRIVGSNATGKTSLLKGLLDLAKGGHDATLLKRGETEGIVGMVLEDGYGGTFDVSKERTTDGSKLKVKHSEAGTLSAAKRWLNERLDLPALSPADFLTAKPKERVDLLLKAVATEADAEAIAAIVGDWIKGVATLAGPALPVIDHVHELVYARRRERNVEARKKGDAAEQLAAGLPKASSEDGEDWAAKAKDIEAEVGKLSVERNRRKEAIREHEAAEIEAAHSAFEAAKAELEKVRDAELMEAQGTADMGAEAVAAELDPAIELANKRHGEAQTAAQAAARAAGARDQVERMKAEAEASKADGERMTGALKELESMKADLLSDLPVPGVSIVEGDIQVDGVPFDRCSTAERTKLAFALCVRRIGEIPIVLADGMEVLDANSLAAFEHAALEAEVQLIYTVVVEEGPLKVETVEAPA